MLMQENILLSELMESTAQCTHPIPPVGALAIVTAWKGCGGRQGSQDEVAFGYGEIVWVRRPDAGVKLKGG
jgi:hypothetical protein